MVLFDIYIKYPTLLFFYFMLNVYVYDIVRFFFALYNTYRTSWIHMFFTSVLIYNLRTSINVYVDLQSGFCDVHATVLHNLVLTHFVTTQIETYIHIYVHIYIFLFVFCIYRFNILFSGFYFSNIFLSSLLSSFSLLFVYNVFFLFCTFLVFFFNLVLVDTVLFITLCFKQSHLEHHLVSPHRTTTQSYHKLHYLLLHCMQKVLHSISSSLLDLEWYI